MTAMLVQFIRTASEDGLQINIWPKTKGDGYQINVKERGSDGWTVVSHEDPVAGLEEALKQRLCRSPARIVLSETQLDIEDAIAVDEMIG